MSQTIGAQATTAGETDDRPRELGHDGHPAKPDEERIPERRQCCIQPQAEQRRDHQTGHDARNHEQAAELPVAAIA